MKYFLSIIILAVFLFGGCAAILHGNMDTVSMQSYPDSAKVYIDGQLMGATPMHLDLQSSERYAVEFSKAGYEKRSVMLHPKVGAGFIVADILCGILPVIVDAATESWYSLDKELVRVTLVPEGTSEGPAGEAAQAGIGITLSNRRVASIVNGSPGDRAGLKKGFFIRRVDGRDMTGNDEQDNQLLWGPKGTSVILVVEAPYGTKTYTMVRDFSAE